MEEQPFERDDKGDMKFPEVKHDWRKYRHTYVFRYRDKKRNLYPRYFDLHILSEKHHELAKSKPGYHEEYLYPSPGPPYDFSIRYNNWQLGLLLKFFKEVFEEDAFIQGHVPIHKYFTVILPLDIRNEILNMINEYGLLPIRSLVFEIISTAQEIYTEDVAHWESPELQKILTTAKSEARKIRELIEKLEDDSWLKAGSKKKRVDLKHINFVLSDGSVKVEHKWLARDFIQHFREHYSDLGMKDWRKDLDRYHLRFEDNKLKQEFKYRLTKSLYNMLTESNLFPLTSQKYPNKLMVCIARIVEFCLIPVGSFSETYSVKARHIRNWLKRKSFDESIISTPFPADTDNLKKYFDPAFIDFTGEVKTAEALGIAAYLGKRFDLMNLVPDFAHIAQALRECSMTMMHGLSGGTMPPDFPEYKAFQKLFESMKHNQKITRIKLTLEGDPSDIELSERLPLHLLERALQEYMTENPAEFETDPVKSKITKVDSGFEILRDKQFNQPEERFLVRFVDAFYTYLRQHAPPEKFDSMPSPRYYAIIGNMLFRTWHFYNNIVPESYCTAKVSEWHDLARKAKSR